MIYIGQFRNKNNELYQVEILTENSIGHNSSELTLTSNPFVVELQGDGGKNIFKPVKYSSATIGIVTNGNNDFMFNMFSSTPHQVPVKLLKVNDDNTYSLKWQGYVEPSVYDMGFNYDKEEFELDCIDDLATLQYFKYSFNDIPTIKSFYDIIKSIFVNHTRYKKLMVANKYCDSDDNVITIDKLYVSELNFIDKENESDGWTEQEVIEEICNYMNLTMYAEGDIVYMTDYTTGKYTEFDLYNSANTTVLNTSNNYTIDGDDYAETGSNISLNPSYNRISVTSKVNEYDEIIPGVFDEAILTSPTNFKRWMLKWKDDGYVSSFKRQDTKTIAEYVLLDNPKYKFYTYTLAGENHPKNIQWDDQTTYDEFVSNLRNSIGAFLMKASFTAPPKTSSGMGVPSAFISSTQNDLKTYLLIANHDAGADHIKVFETNAECSNPSYFVDNDARLILNCSALFMDKENWEYIPTDYNNKKDFEGRYMYIPAVIKWGDYYYNNSAGRTATGINNLHLGFKTDGNWTKTPSACRIQFDCSDTSNLLNTEHRILDTSGYYSFDIDSGFILPPVPEPQTSAPHITLYTNGRIRDNVRNEYIWISDFSFKLVIPHKKQILEEEWESDTEYTNVINENYVEDGDEMECKINTYDKKAPSHSYCLYKKDNLSNYDYIDEVKSISNEESHRLEEHKILDYVTQYKEPTISLEINYKDLHIPTNSFITVPVLSNTKKFIIDSYTKDYYNCNNKITIIEKRWIL